MIMKVMSKYWKKGFFLFFMLIIFTVMGCSATLNPKENKHEKTVTNQETINQNNPGDISSPISEPQNKKDTGILLVHFIDVGQADAIFLQLPNNQTMLIDAGNNKDAGIVVNYIRKTGVKKIHYLVGTHPHEDHIGGIDTVIESFDIEKVIMPKVNHTTKTFRDVLTAVKKKDLKITRALSGKTILNNKYLTIKILGPVDTNYEELNNYSAVIKVTYKKTDFLFTGDAEKESEKQILQSGANIKSDVLKIGHHGSNSSTTQPFLDQINPQYGVISVGKDNDYDHPSKKTLNRLKKSGVKVFRTDKDGTLIFKSDGNSISISKQH